jgi:tol-pal system protein YbgF
VPLAITLKKIAYTAAVSAAVLLMQSCITDLTAIRAEINNLKQDSYEAKKSISSLKSNQDSLKRDVGVIKGQPSGVAGENSLAAVRASQADLYSQISDTLKELQDISGQMEERTYLVDKRLQEFSAEVEVVKSRIDSIEDLPQEPASRRPVSGGTIPPDIAERLSRIEGDIVFLKAKLTAMGGAPTASPPHSAGVTKISPEDAYRSAFALYKEAKFSMAREAMQKFIKDYPDDPLAGNAQFWIGETYYRERDFASAILAYEEVIKNYSSNRKVSAAMLKQGFAFANMGEKDAAKSILNQVIEKYPDSDVANAAKEKLDSLK